MPALKLRYKLLTNYPEVARLWHPTRNKNKKPEDFTPKSHEKVWWLCDKGHEWEANIGNRTGGGGCPYCSGNKASEDDNLATNYPEVARQWHPTRNVDKKPEDFRPKSNKRAWWLCDKGHEWEANINSRTGGIGCGKCSGRIASEGHNLLTNYPDVARPWHPTKNETRKPEDFTPGSNKKAWWLCSNGHEWEAIIGSRTLGQGCAKCAKSGRKSAINITA
jgi:hypothetical protein